MMKNQPDQQKQRHLFQNLGTQGKQNLILVALLAFYLAQISMNIYSDGILSPVSFGADFLAFWGAGHIANTTGYQYVYDLDILKQVQEQIAAPISDPTKAFSPIPAPFLPIFILPFQFLALIPPKVSFLLWTIVNLAALILYLHFLIRELAPDEPEQTILAFLLISYPVYSCVFWGQINTWLVIFIGEFMRASLKGKNFRAGLWLSGLLLKPQILFLIALYPLIRRSWKTLIGFGIASFVIVAASFALAGVAGFTNLIGLWLSYASGLPSNAPENMMNWRMLGLHLSAYTTPTIGWGIAIAGMIATLLAWLYLVVKRPSNDRTDFVVTLVGTLAATNVITWHSHLHMLMLLFPLLIYVIAQKRLSYRYLYRMNYLFPIGLLLVFALALLGKFSLFPLFGFGGLILGLCGIGINLSLLAWSIKTA